jgi:hypothetical protein
MNLRVASGGLRITEVPSMEGPRQHGVSKLNAFGDGWRVLRTILAEYRRHRELNRTKVPDVAFTTATEQARPPVIPDQRPVSDAGPTHNRWQDPTRGSAVLPVPDGNL